MHLLSKYKKKIDENLPSVPLGAGNFLICFSAITYLIFNFWIEAKAIDFA